MDAGDLLVLKATGEKVIVLPAQQGQASSVVSVRRANVTEVGSLTHFIELFFEFELETLEQHAERQIEEQKIKILANETIESWMNARQQQEVKKAPIPFPKAN